MTPVMLAPADYSSVLLLSTGNQMLNQSLMVTHENTAGTPYVFAGAEDGLDDGAIGSSVFTPPKEGRVPVNVALLVHVKKSLGLFGCKFCS